MGESSIFSDIVHLLFEHPLIGILVVAAIAFVIIKSNGWGEAGKFLFFIIALVIVGFIGSIVLDFFGELLEKLSDITGIKESIISILAKIIGIIAGWAIFIWLIIGNTSREKDEEENKDK